MFTKADAGYKLSLAFDEAKVLGDLPKTAKLIVTLYENKTSRTLDFGSIEGRISSVEIPSGLFEYPSISFKVVGTEDKTHGKILASTDPWKQALDPDDSEHVSKEGILPFKASDIYPLVWDLELNDATGPVLVIDRQIPRGIVWAQSNPIFLSCVFPAMIERIFRHIRLHDSSEADWIQQWQVWGDELVSGMPLAKATQDADAFESWLRELKETFCDKHDFHASLTHLFEQQRG
ncbi:MAG: hypothetical protein Alpg2KO_07990 [Alphaproteobacteria bacterium]